jgi:hypothetical protein
MTLTERYERLVKLVEDEKRICEGATPGPWEADSAEPWDIVVWGPGEKGPLVFNVGANPAPVRIGEPACENELADAHFIAVARTLTPQLLALAESRLAEAKDEIRHIGLEWEGAAGHAHAILTELERCLLPA